MVLCSDDYVTAYVRTELFNALAIRNLAYQEANKLNDNFRMLVYSIMANSCEYITPVILNIKLKEWTFDIEWGCFFSQKNDENKTTYSKIKRKKYNGKLNFEGIEHLPKRITDFAQELDSKLLNLIKILDTSVHKVIEIEGFIKINNLNVNDYGFTKQDLFMFSICHGNPLQAHNQKFLKKRCGPDPRRWTAMNADSTTLRIMKMLPIAHIAVENYDVIRNYESML